MFNCARCHRQVLICQYCDHGHIYCLEGCAVKARNESLRRASKRYGATRRGRHANAARQRLFRERHREKVTHHGSDLSWAFVVVLLALNRPGSVPSAPHAQPRAGITCHLCRRQCSAFVRRQWLHQIRRAGAGD